MTALIIRGDARHLPLPDNSVDLIVTSPPYFGLRSYQDGGEHFDGQIGDEARPLDYVGNLLTCTREWMRVLKPEGSLWINLGDKYSGYNNGSGKGRSLAGERRESRVPDGGCPHAYGVPNKSLMGLPWRYALGCIDELGLILRAEVIWDKPNGLPESVTDRVRRSHEQWFHFTLQPRYYSAVDEIRTPVSDYSRRSGARRVTPPGQRRRAMTDSVNPLGALPGSVWEIATQPLKVPDHLGASHYAAFPMSFPRRIIRGWSPPAGLVVDPFGGTGTTALLADVLGRCGVSIDRSADYCRIAAWRTTAQGERAKALRAPKPPPIVRDHPTLFNGAGEFVS